MSERYTKLYAVEENQYCEGAPVVVQAGALLRDNQMGELLGQFKFICTVNKTIKGLLVEINAFDISGKKLLGVPEYQYLDLSAARNISFGQKTAVPLPDPVTRSISIRCVKAVFGDGTVWTAAQDAVWKSLPKQQLIGEVMDHELAEQYRRDTCSNANYIPLDYKDLWLCTCGGINRENEAACCCCNNDKTNLISLLDTENLLHRNAAYIAMQKEIAAVKAQEKAKRKKRNTKIAALGVCILLIVMLLCNSVYEQVHFSRAVIDRLQTGNYTISVAPHDYNYVYMVIPLINDTDDGYIDFQIKIDFGEKMVVNDSIDVWKPGEVWEVTFEFALDELQESAAGGRANVECTYKEKTR